MKKPILLFTALSGFAYLTLTSYMTGPAHNGEGNRTGSNPNSAMQTCAGSTCHGSNDNTTQLTLTLQPITGPGAPITPGQAYTPGTVYKVVLLGSNVALPSTGKFGFQMTATDINGNNAGTFQVSSGIDVHLVDNSSTMGKKVIEHTAPLGTGNNFNTNTANASFNWGAPNSGAVTFHVIVNATNGNGSADAGDHATLASFTFADPNSVAELAEHIRITAYPNPASAQVNLRFEGADAGNYDIAVLDLNGRLLHNEQVQVTNAAASTAIQADNWASGLYMVRIMKDGAQRIIPVSKQ